jgi:hypothetical protein
MNRTRFLQTAAALMSIFPLGAGAVSDTKREHSAGDSSIAREGVTGRDLAVQVDSEHDLDRLGHHRERGKHDAESNGATLAALGSFDHPAVVSSDQAGSGPTPVPEPSSMMLFATSLLLARGVTKRREVSVYSR